LYIIYALPNPMVCDNNTIRSIVVAYLNPLNFLKISLMFGSGDGFLFICALSVLKSVKIRTSPVFLSCINLGAPH
jgi:hypothetical protein